MSLCCGWCPSLFKRQSRTPALQDQSPSSLPTPLRPLRPVGHNSLVPQEPTSHTQPEACPSKTRISELSCPEVPTLTSSHNDLSRMRVPSSTITPIVKYPPSQRATVLSSNESHVSDSFHGAALVPRSSRSREVQASHTAPPPLSPSGRIFDTNPVSKLPPTHPPRLALPLGRDATPDSRHTAFRPKAPPPGGQNEAEGENEVCGVCESVLAKRSGDKQQETQTSGRKDEMCEVCVRVSEEHAGVEPQNCTSGPAGEICEVCERVLVLCTVDSDKDTSLYPSSSPAAVVNPLHFMSSPIFQPSAIENNVVQDSRAAEAAAASPEAKEMLYPYCAKQTPPSTFCPTSSPLPVKPAGGKHPISPGEMKTSMFNGAKNVRMGNININAIQAHGPTIAMNISQPQENCKHEHACPIEGWNQVKYKAAPNALLDSSARYDAPKCDEDTRVEVIDEIMDFISDRDGACRLLCMTGAAGSGKSALQQTTAEICAKSDIVAAVFFISATDPTRNSVSPIVPTLAFQMGSCNHALRNSIGKSVAEDPFIFQKSMKTQMDVMIGQPFKLCRDNAEVDLTTLPYAIFIDGIDECSEQAHQFELLDALRNSLLVDDLPFRIFIASRPELAIRTALEPGGHLNTMAHHIPLSDKYFAEKDLYVYLRKRFHALSSRVGNPQWFTEDNLKTLVRAASGQFIYVATVFKYVSEPRGSPAHRLQIILTWTQHNDQHARPFEVLDRLYTNILLAAKEAYEAIDTNGGRDFLFLFRIYQVNETGFQFQDSTRFQFSNAVLTALLNLEIGAAENLLSDLRSLLTISKDQHGELSLRPYHKSFYDFLDDKRRSKDLFIPTSAVFVHVAKCCMQSILKFSPDHDSCTTTGGSTLPISNDGALPLSVALRDAVARLPLFLVENTTTIGDDILDFTRQGGWHVVDKILPSLYIEGPSGSWFNHTTWLRRLEKVHASLEGASQSAQDCAVIGDFCRKWRQNESY